MTSSHLVTQEVLTSIIVYKKNMFGLFPAKGIAPSSLNSEHVTENDFVWALLWFTLFMLYLAHRYPNINRAP